MHKPQSLKIAGAIFAALAMAGCNRATMQVSSLPTLSGVLPAAASTPKPTPTPTPDPLLKFRAIQQVPVWAKKRVINEVPLKPGEKLFALTFDDGPWPQSTEAILQILAQYKVKATFYMVGQMVRTHPKIAREVRDDGHAVGNHSWSHPSRPRDPAG